jgi:hypothetical protein
MSGDEGLTDAQIERELVAIARSRRRTQLQPRASGLRAILRHRVEARKAERREEERRRQEERRREEELRRKPPPAYSWEFDTLTDEQRREWLELDLVSTMAAERGWRYIGPAEWRRGSRRVRRLQQEADAILRAPNPLEAFQEWRAANTARGLVPGARRPGDAAAPLIARAEVGLAPGQHMNPVLSLRAIRDLG